MDTLNTVGQEIINIPRSKTSFTTWIGMEDFSEVFILKIFFISIKKVCYKAIYSSIKSPFLFSHHHETIKNIFFCKRAQII